MGKSKGVLLMIVVISALALFRYSQTFLISGQLTP